MTDSVVRDAAWNEREFGRDKWPAIAALIEEACAVTPPELARVVSYVSRREHGVDPLSEQRVVLGGVELALPQGAALGALQALIVETVIAACGDGVDAVVELGSGWGRNLLLTWLGSGPRGALYVGAELTAAGRDAASRLASLEPGLRFESIAFDYETPDLGQIAGHDRAVVFTVHSADYVRDLAASVFDEIRGVARNVTCIHLENFGWQVHGGPSVARDYALANDYNRNLYALVESERDAGHVELDQVSLDIAGLHPGYVASLLVWRSSP